MKNRKAIAIGALLFLLLPAAAALALSQPLTGIYSETLSVTTTAERVTSEYNITTGWKSCTIWNNSATILYVGGSDVDATDGFPICTDTASCPDSKFTADATGFYVVSASGTLTPRLICGR
jgi:cobalamin biosynthesis protein CbiD